MAILLWYLLFAGPALATTCYLQDGTNGTAQVNANYVQCPSVPWCCPTGLSCASNGLCIDQANKPDGSNITFGGTKFNLTGLYQMPGCVNEDFSGCVQECPLQKESQTYAWACDDGLTEYCCVGEFWQNIYNHRSCCNDNSSFELQKAVVMTTASASIAAATAASASGSAAPSGTPTGEGGAGGGLSTGAKVGIGLGVVALVAGLVGIVLAFMLCFRRRKNHVQETGQVPQEIETHEKNLLDSKPQQYAFEVDTSREPSEVPGNSQNLSRYRELP